MASTSTKKAPAKKAAVKRTVKAKLDTNMYVVSERSRFFVWTPKYYSKDYNEAVSLRRNLETTSIYGGRGAKLDIVKPITTVKL